MAVSVKEGDRVISFGPIVLVTDVGEATTGVVDGTAMSCEIDTCGTSEVITADTEVRLVSEGVTCTLLFSTAVGSIIPTLVGN